MARFGVSGKSTGRLFTEGGHVWRDDDTAPEGDRRIDIYNPSYAGIDLRVVELLLVLSQFVPDLFDVFFSHRWHHGRIDRPKQFDCLSRRFVMSWKAVSRAKGRRECLDAGQRQQVLSGIPISRTWHGGGKESLNFSLACYCATNSVQLVLRIT